MARVKRRRRFHAFEHRDRRRQPVVQLAQDAGRRQIVAQLADFDVSHLADGMHPRVGAPGALQIHLDAEQFIRHALQIALHAARVDLRLPAGELGAVVFESQSESPHAIAIMREARSTRGMRFRIMKENPSGRRLTSVCLDSGSHRLACYVAQSPSGKQVSITKFTRTPKENFFRGNPMPSWSK